MLVRDKAGDYIRITLYVPNAEDIQIDTAIYVNDNNRVVTEDTIDYITQKYNNEMYEHWMDSQKEIDMEDL